MIQHVLLAYECINKWTNIKELTDVKVLIDCQPCLIT
jgi:hypothetical protein